MPQIDVVRSVDLRSGDSTQGIVRDTASELPGMTVARSRVAGGVSSAWHHHGERDLLGFLLLGRLRFDYGPKGTQAVEPHPGDFFHIPRRLVHRDVNPTRDQTAVIVNVSVGEGAVVINVQGPDD
ncbi:MAG: cupin domain-containing protein [Thermoplasmata archaeon]